MAEVHFTRNDVADLCTRLEARGTSHVLRESAGAHPRHEAAAALLRFMLDHGMPVAAVEIEVVNNGL